MSPEFLSENNKLTYDVYGKVLEVEENSGSNTKVKYYYGVGGQRIKKETYSGGTLSMTTWYVGSHIYEKVGAGSIIREEILLNGAGRIGTAYYTGSSWEYRYELSDHLGNIRAVVREGSSSLEVMSYSDYYPYGWTMPGRTSGSYRYGYQGEFAEKDEETGWNAFELRMYDSRMARWMSTDPAKQFYSPYMGFWNNPSNTIDREGEWAHIVGGFLIGAVAKGAQIVINEGWDGLGKQKNWAKIGLGGVEGAVIALNPTLLATGGVSALSEVGEQLIDHVADGKSLEEFVPDAGRVFYSGAVGIVGGKIGEKYGTKVIDKFVGSWREKSLREAVYNTTKTSIIAEKWNSRRFGLAKSIGVSVTNLTLETTWNITKGFDLPALLPLGDLYEISNFGNYRYNGKMLENRGFYLPTITVTPDEN